MTFRTTANGVSTASDGQKPSRCSSNLLSQVECSLGCFEMRAQLTAAAKSRATAYVGVELPLALRRIPHHLPSGYGY